LARAYELNGVLAQTQLVNQLGQGQRHAIDLWWPRLRHNRDAHGRIFWLDVFYQDTVSHDFFHESDHDFLI
jgi:hypothetical protein